MTQARKRHGEDAYKKAVRIFFLSVAVIFLLPLCALTLLFYIADPLQLYHKSWFQKDRIIPSEYEQMAGIINTHEFDSIILGTSMLQNSSTLEAEKELGGKFANISIAGSNLVARRLILERAMRRRLRHVILSVEPWYYLEYTQDNVSYPRSYWDFLYDNNPFNDMKVYFSHKFLHNLSQKGLFVPYERDAPFSWKHLPISIPFFEALKQWPPQPDNKAMIRFVHEQLPAALAAWNQREKPLQPRPDQQKLRKAKKYIDENVLNAAREYPDTRFSLLMPPFSRFYYADLWHRDPESFLIHQEITRYLAREAARLGNVNVYGFEDASFLDDMGNYRDYCHYFSPVNSMMTKAIARGQHRLTPQNVESYLELCRQKAAAWDLPAFGRKVQRIIRDGSGADAPAGNAK